MLRTLALSAFLALAIATAGVARQSTQQGPEGLSLARQIVALSPQAPKPYTSKGASKDFSGPRSLVMLITAFSATDFEIDLDQFDRSYEAAEAKQQLELREHVAAFMAERMSVEDLRAILVFASSPEGRAEVKARESYLRRLEESPEETGAIDYKPTGAELAFEQTPAGRKLLEVAAAAQSQDWATDAFSQIVKNTKSDYCRRKTCGPLQEELFTRLGVILSPGRANGERATWGSTAGDLFTDPKVADLARAACDGRSDAIFAAVQAGVDPNSKGGEATVRDVEIEQMTPLLWAIDCKNAVGIESLLKAGADPNLKVSTGDTPTTAAVRSSDPTLLVLLLKYGGNPNALEENDTALILAIQEAIELEADGVDPERAWTNWRTLLAAGADINGATPLGQTTIEAAALSRRYDRVLDLIALGARYDPVELGASVQADEDYPGEADAQRDRVKAILVAKGVKFPVPALLELQRDQNGYYIQP